MKVKILKESIERILDSYPEAETFDVLISLGNDYAMVKPEIVYEGSMWNIVIDCDYKPDEVVEEIKINTKKKIYIAGKISGEDVASCTMKFGKAQKELEQQGFEVLNPLEIVGTWKITWEEAMKKCISALITADALVLLHDFKESKGAMIEEKLASDLNMRVFIGTRDLDQRLKRKDD